jgi:hypothetical protein
MYVLTVYIVTNFLLFIVIKVINDYNFKMYLIICTKSLIYNITELSDHHTPLT